MGKLRYLRLSGRGRVLVWLSVLLLLALLLIGMVLLHMKPILTNLATSRVSNSVRRIMVAAVSDAIEQGEIDYQRLITCDKDTAGRITALRSNMAEFNRLQSAITEDILARMAEVATTELSIPIGTLTGSSLLAGRGPSFQVKMQWVGSANAAFRNDFTAAGINQTKHQVILNMEVSATILLPGFHASTKVNHEISVAETIIVGSVPQTYTNFSTTEGEITEYADEYIINKG